MQFLYYYHYKLTLTQQHSWSFEGISWDDVHLQALSSSEVRPRTQIQSVLKQLCLSRSLSLLEAFLCRRRDLFRLLLLFLSVDTFCEFTCPCKLPLRQLWCSVSKIHMRHSWTSLLKCQIFDLKILFNTFFLYHFCHRYIFAPYNSGNCRKFVQTCSVPCSLCYMYKSEKYIKKILYFNIY